MSNPEKGKGHPRAGDTNQTIVGSPMQTIASSDSSQTISTDGSSMGSVIRSERPDDNRLLKSLESMPNYQIEAKLGEGGMGAVYRARQRALNRTVALKVLPQRLCDNPMYVARLNREAL